MKVVEIFNSIEGEGKRVGLPSTFIRLFGCNLNCSYCDSRYACEGEDGCGAYMIMTAEGIVDRVKSIGCPFVTVTGGEPMIHTGIHKLLELLVKERFYVNVETNGSVSDLVDYGPGVFYTVDYKTLSSEMSMLMDEAAFTRLNRGDVVKFVVGSTDDLDQALEVMEKLDCKAQVFVSPIFGKIEPRVIVEYIQYHKLWNWRAQVQLHKIIWDPEQRGV